MGGFFSTVGSNYVVLVDIGAEWPDVLGPFVNLSEARAVADLLLDDARVERAEVQLDSGADLSGYLSALDDLELEV